MNKIEVRYRNGLKELMKTVPLDEISVISLCEHIGSNRQTFYYHYRDIYDVINSILLEDKIDIHNHYETFSAILKPAISYVKINYSFIRCVLNSNARDLLEQTFYSYFYKKVGAYTKKYLVNKTHIVTNTVINREISTIFSKELIFWANDRKREQVKHLEMRLAALWDYFTTKYPNDADNMNLGI